MKRAVITLGFGPNGIVISKLVTEGAEPGLPEMIGVVEHHAGSEPETTHGRTCNMLLPHVVKLLKEVAE